MEPLVVVLVDMEQQLLLQSPQDHTSTSGCSGCSSSTTTTTTTATGYYSDEDDYGYGSESTRVPAQRTPVVFLPAQVPQGYLNASGSRPYGVNI